MTNIIVNVYIVFVSLILTLIVLSTNCYPAKSNVDLRISGGVDTSHGSAPYNVMVLFRNTLICSGSILSKRTILTSEQCVDAGNPSSFSIITNTTKISQPGNLYKVINIKYRGLKRDHFERTHDLALLYLEKDIKLSKDVQIIEVRHDDVEAGLEAIARGWGLTNSIDVSVPDNLQEIRLKTIDFEECKKTWQNIMELHDDEICAVAENGGGMCYADAGGALVHEGKAIGVSSWGYGCAFGKPDVFTSLYFHLNWIRDNLI